MPREARTDKTREGDNSVTDISTTMRMELAHRSGAGVYVTLVWMPGVDKTLVCVDDRRDGSHIERPAEPYLALEVYRHPFVYRDFSTVDLEDSRLTAA